jgi:hypothetical protein
MIGIPTTLLCSPVRRKSFRRPFGDPVVDRHWKGQRKYYRKNLNGESNWPPNAKPARSNAQTAAEEGDSELWMPPSKTASRVQTKTANDERIGI